MDLVICWLCHEEVFEDDLLICNDCEGICCGNCCRGGICDECADAILYDDGEEIEDAEDFE